MSDAISPDLHELSDEQLSVFAKQGSQDAFSILVGRYLFTLRSRAAGYNLSGIEFDDLVQEGMIGLLNAARCYDPNCNTAFSTFARLCIDRNIISAVRSSLRKKQIPPSMLVFLDDYKGDGPYKADGGDNPEAMVIAREGFDALVEKISKELSKTEIKVLQLYLKGLSYEDIAQQLECSAKSVDNAIQRLRRKLK